MKQNRVILVLIAVVVLLGVILGIKVLTNAPEAQPEIIIKDEIQNDKDKIQNDKDKIQNDKDKTQNDKSEMSVMQENISNFLSLVRVYIRPIVYFIFFIIGITKLYIKLGVPVFPFKVIWISGAVLILVLIMKNIFIDLKVVSAFAFFISIIANTIIGIFSIIIAIQFLGAIGLDFSNIIFLGIVPVILASVMAYIRLALIGSIIASICVLILHIKTMNKIANALNKKVLCKAALIICPIIMLPVLGFQKQK